MLRILLSLACFACAPAYGLSPSEVFEKVSPSVWAVRSIDFHERRINYGSAVVIGPGRLVTSCHVIDKAEIIQVGRGNITYGAEREHSDARDFCTLTVAEFNAPAVETVSLAQVKIGQRVYAVGNPEKLALTLSDGIVSGLRSDYPGLPPIQTTAPISSGSSGGGLFDDQARLIGITTSVIHGRSGVAQNLNFAIPAEWIEEMLTRAEERIARLKTARQAGTAATANAALPPVGTSWRYRFVDRQYAGSEQDFSVGVSSINGWSVAELFAFEGDRSSGPIDAQDLRFHRRPLRGGYSALELAPYLLAFEPSPSLPLKHTFVGYQSGRTPAAWKLGVAQIEHEHIAVRAGRFRAVRMRILGENPSAGLGDVFYGQTLPGREIPPPMRFEYTIWYAAEVGRYVMVRHRTWSRTGELISDEEIQLVEYKSQ